MKVRLLLDQEHLLIIFSLLALLLVLVIWRIFRKWTAAEENPFDIRDLFMENGRASKGSVVLLGAFAATTWFFVYYALLGKMTEGYFGVYGALWVTPIVARMLTGSNGAASPAAPAVVTTTTETTVVKP